MRNVTARLGQAALLKIALSAGLLLSFATPALAGPTKVVQAYATGQIVSQSFCSPTEVCQVTLLSGTATVLGRFTGVLIEQVDLTTGTFTGTAVFTTTDQSTISTQSSGQLTPPDSRGRVYFFETHQVVGGTGKFANAQGFLNVVGTSDQSGQIQILGLGTLTLSQ